MKCEVREKDEISNMLDAKVFCNVRRYTKDGSFSDVKYKKDDNLIIKGDNLAVLSSILRRFEKKIKCIYIDPPYNTGSDSFNYHDSFKHPTWLTFMKNRLVLAKRLLRDDGVIFVQCDDNEQAYLKVLMDEIMGRESFVANLIWQKKKGGAQDSKYFAKEHEYILCYKKEGWHIYDEREEYQKKDFSHVINGRKGKLLKLEKWGAGSLRTDAPTLYYPIKDPNGCDFYPLAPNGEEGRWRKKPEGLDDAHIFWKLNSKKRFTPYEVIYFDEVDFKIVKTRTILTDYGTTRDGTKEIQNLFNKKVFSTTKPEKLLHKILSVSTREGDIVLDFFMGSATTCAVAHKMGRQYIGIEKMDYIKTISVSRLIKVLEGEGGGISKAVNWGGGGTFIYCELKEDRQDLGDYINYSDIDDERVSLSECDREFNISFYDVGG